MGLEGLMGIVRTRGVETARRRTTGEGALIGLDPPQCETLRPGRGGEHLGHDDAVTCRWIFETNRRTVRSSSANVCSQAGGRAPMRYSPGGTSHAANTARSRRRSRLRWTAVPTARPMANATCGGTRSGSGTNEHHSGSVRIRTPSRRRRTKASRSRTRSIKPRDGRGPWRDGTSTRLDLHGCSCGHESRACGLGDGCLADRYASRLTPDGSRQITFRRRPHRSHSIGCAPHGLTWQG